MTEGRGRFPEGDRSLMFCGGALREAVGKGNGEKTFADVHPTAGARFPPGSRPMGHWRSSVEVYGTGTARTGLQMCAFSYPIGFLHAAVTDPAL